jgi:hypothetical protein
VEIGAERLGPDRRTAVADLDCRRGKDARDDRASDHATRVID